MVLPIKLLNGDDLSRVPADTPKFQRDSKNRHYLPSAQADLNAGFRVSKPVGQVMYFEIFAEAEKLLSRNKPLQFTYPHADHPAHPKDSLTSKRDKLHTSSQPWKLTSLR